MARDFSGTDGQYLGTSTVVVESYPFTIAAWVRFDEAADEAGDSVLTTSRADFSHYFFLGRDGDGKIVFAARDGVGPVGAVSPATISLNTWYRICAVGRSRTDRSIFVDGGDEATDTVDRLPTSLERTQVGAIEGLSPMHGRIAEVKVWNVALEDNEIIADALGVDVRPEAIAGGNGNYWPLYGLDSPEPDLGGGKVNLTLFLTPAQANHAPVPPYSSRFWGHGPLIGVVPAPPQLIETIKAQLVFGEGPGLPVGSAVAVGQFHTGAVPLTTPTERGFLSRPFLG